MEVVACGSLTTTEGNLLHAPGIRSAVKQLKLPLQAPAARRIRTPHPPVEAEFASEVSSWHIHSSHPSTTQQRTRLLAAAGP